MEEAGGEVRQGGGRGGGRDCSPSTSQALHCAVAHEGTCSDGCITCCSRGRMRRVAEGQYRGMLDMMEGVAAEERRSVSLSRDRETTQDQWD